MLFPFRTPPFPFRAPVMGIGAPVEPFRAGVRRPQDGCSLFLKRFWNRLGFVYRPGLVPGPTQKAGATPCAEFNKAVEDVPDVSMIQYI
jgi:hypothetical protein